MRNEETKIFCYMDDAFLTPGSEDDFQKLIHKFNKIAKKLNMNILTQKTKALVISKEQTRCKIEYGWTSIEQIMEITNSGITVSSYVDMETEGWVEGE